MVIFNSLLRPRVVEKQKNIGGFQLEIKREKIQLHLIDRYVFLSSNQRTNMVGKKNSQDTLRRSDHLHYLCISCLTCYSWFVLVLR